jgi:hypothetical protein
LKKANSALFYAAYNRKMLYLLPNTRKLNRPKKGSLEDAEKLALKDIKSDSLETINKNRQIKKNNISYQQETDKDINTLWFPEADNNLKNFFIDYYDFSTERWGIALTEWDWIHSRELSNLLYNIMKDEV